VKGFQVVENGRKTDMSIRIIPCVLATAALMGMHLPASVSAQNRHRVLAQDDAPIRVVEYDAQIWGTGSEIGDGVRHELRFRNDSDRGVVAVKFGLLSYDIFNEFQEETETIVVQDLAPGDGSRQGVVVFPPDPAAFYTGLAYVRKVRFLDGEIWEASPEELDALIQAFELELNQPGGD
jgi:hypothetical protein